MTTTTNTRPAASAATSAPSEATTPAPCPNTKISMVIALLERGEGATLDEMTEATGWLPHSARAVLTGLRKKGHTIVKSQRDDVTCYRIVGAA